MHRTNFLAAICVLAVLSMADFSFGLHHFPDYPVRSPDAYPDKVDKSGLIVAVEPVEDREQQKTYFNSHLSSKGMLPVFLIIWNNSASDTYLFDSSAVGLADALDINSPGVRQSRARVGSGGLVDLTLITEATEVRENMMKKQLRSKTLSPGASVHGFVYVPVPINAPRPKTHLQVALTNAQSGEIEVLNLFF